MRCTNCGTDAPDQASQCPSCGTVLTAAAPGGADQGGWGAAAPGGWPSPAAPPPVSGGYPPPGYQQPAPSYPPPPQAGWAGGGGGGYPSPPPAWDGGGAMGGRVGNLAGWWYRVGATLIDVIVLGVINVVIGAAGGRALEYVGGLVVGLVYNGVLLSNRGQTVGMMALGTRCVRERGGQYLTIGPAIGRYLLGTLLELTVIGGLLDVLWPLWDGKNQTIHDKAVGSLVVHAR